MAIDPSVIENTKKYVSYDNLKRIKEKLDETYAKSSDISGGIINGIPIGGIVEYPSSKAIPDGWLECDGSAVSRKTYSELFAKIGTNYGKGDGSTTFNLPNKKGKVSVGLDTSDSDFNVIGKTGGEKAHTLTHNELPNSSLKIPHVAYYNDCTVSGGGWVQSGRESMEKEGAAQNNTNDGWHIMSLGNDQAHNNLQPYFVTRYIIKATQDTAVIATVVDGLNSMSSKNALSANQGKVLNDAITNIAGNMVSSDTVKQIKIVTEYPKVEEENVLYLKVE